MNKFIGLMVTIMIYTVNGYRYSIFEQPEDSTQFSNIKASDKLVSVIEYYSNEVGTIASIF